MPCRSFPCALFVLLAGAVLKADPAVLPSKPASQDSDAPLSSPLEPQNRYSRWSSEDGLPQNSVGSLAQTKDGYLWAGTLYGLARFDGVRFKVFDHRNTPEMSFESINDLEVDAVDGSLWISTEAGLLHYQDHAFQRYGDHEGNPKSSGILLPARNGGVWYSPRPGQVGLARDGRVKTWDFGTETSTNTVSEIVEENDSQTLLLRKNLSQFVYRFDLNTKSVEPFTAPFGNSPCTSMVAGAGRSTWFCTADGIWHKTEAGWTKLTDPVPGAASMPDRVFGTRSGQLWATQVESDHRSLLRLVSGKLVPIDGLRLPEGGSPMRLIEDREGNIWVGAATGLFRLRAARLKAYSRDEGMVSDETLAVTGGTEGTIWVGTERGVNRIRNGQVGTIPAPGGGWDKHGVAVFLVDSQNALWAGSSGNFLARYRQDHWESIENPPQLRLPATLRALSEDREGRIWIGTDTEVMCRVGTEWNSFSTTDGLSNSDVRYFYQDRQGDMWLGTVRRWIESL